MQAMLLKKERLEALTDGIFAIAMTILILDLHLPDKVDPYTLNTFLETDVLQKIFIYMGSFIILGTQWVAINFQQGFLAGVNRPYLWANILYLMINCIVPFSAKLLAEYPHSQPAIIFYVLNLMLANFGQILTWYCSQYFQLNGNLYKTYARWAIMSRIIIAPFFYAAAFVISFWDSNLAFVALVLPPLIYIVPGRVDHYQD